MIVFNKRDSEGEILSTITVGADYKKFSSVKEMLEYCWNELPHGYKLEQY